MYVMVINWGDFQSKATKTNDVTVKVKLSEIGEFPTTDRDGKDNMFLALDTTNFTVVERDRFKNQITQNLTWMTSSPATSVDMLLGGAQGLVVGKDEVKVLSYQFMGP